MRNNDADHLHDQVKRQGLTSVCVGRGRIQPAFGRDIDAGKRKPDHHPHQGPGDPVWRHRIHDQHRRNHRAKRREHPHMANPADHVGGHARAKQKAQKIARHHHRHLQGGEMLKAATDAQQSSLHAIAKHQEHDAQQQGPGIAQNCQHGVGLLVGLQKGSILAGETGWPSATALVRNASGEQERTVAIREETIVMRDGMAIDRLDPVLAHERRDQHQQG